MIYEYWCMVVGLWFVFFSDEWSKPVPSVTFDIGMEVFHKSKCSLRWLRSLETEFSSSRLAGSPMIGVKDILMNVRVHFRGPCSVQTTEVAHLLGLWNPDTWSSPPPFSCSRGLRRLINVSVFSLLKPIRCTLSGHAQQNITLFRRTAAPPLPSLTPQQSRLSKSRGRLAFGRDWPSG